ncbi:LutC/YkgG family protein [Thermus islandicus]|uniref:LutC/YkgG family protein n=1 Tax=Thermus islandicus TaxID=540988 RepID=UPI0003B7B283|nr:LUD domain-containing protein [Thermus islandicus]
MDPKARILARLRRALEGRPKALLPPHPHTPLAEDPVDLLLRRLQENGAEAKRLSREEAKAFALSLAQGLPGAAMGKTLPEDLRPPLPELPPEEAPLGLSYALFAVAETGSVALSSEDGRRAQLLPPTHLVFVEAGRVYGTLLEALAVDEDLKALPAALGLHSGPSKSADIGQVMVKGVHGPGRLVVAVLT